MIILANDYPPAPISSPEPNLQSVPISAETRFEREVKGSDDEADDSDSEASLADLSTLLKSHSSKDLSKISTDRLTPTTPVCAFLFRLHLQ
jgi:hypothetical protein